MPAISYVGLAVDSVSNDNTTPTLIGSPSASLTQSAPYLMLVMGHCATTNGQSHVRFLVDGVVSATMTNHQPFGANNDITPALSGTAQLGCAFLYTPAGASEEMTFEGWCDDVDFFATSCRAYALNLSGLVENTQRWHTQTANDDTIVDTPTSGWEAVGNTLTFTAPVTGNYLIVASLEAVGGTTADFVNVRLTQDGVQFSGAYHEEEVSTTDLSQPLVFARVVSLTATVEYDFQLEANGTTGGGNVGYRRIRLHAISAAAIEDGDIQQDLDGTGATISGTGSVQLCSLTLAPPASRDYLCISNDQMQLSWWAQQLFLFANTTDEPPFGFQCSVDDAGLGPTNDLVITHGFFVQTIASSTELELFIQTGPGATGAGGGAEIGAGTSTAEGGDVVLIAMRLQTSAVNEGEFAGVLPVPTMSATGEVAHTGTFAGALPVPTFDAAGDVAHTGSFAGTLPVPVLAATGNAAHTGVFSATLLVPTMSASGEVAHAGVFAGTLPLIGLAALGVVTPGPPPPPPTPPTPTPTNPTTQGGGPGFFPPWFFTQPSVEFQVELNDAMMDKLAFEVAAELAALLSRDPLAKLPARLTPVTRPRRRR